MAADTPSPNLSNVQTAKLLHEGLAEPVRPIDALVTSLRAPDGWKRLERSFCHDFSDEEIALLRYGGKTSTDSAEKLSQLKDRAKSLVADAPTVARAQAAMAVYCLAVAAGLAFHNVLHSSRSAAEWSDLFADLASVAPPQWRGVLLQAAEKALLRATT